MFVQTVLSQLIGSVLYVRDDAEGKKECALICMDLYTCTQPSNMGCKHVRLNKLELQNCLEVVSTI